jgi:hypothetical protein
VQERRSAQEQHKLEQPGRLGQERRSAQEQHKLSGQHMLEELKTKKKCYFKLTVKQFFNNY